MDYSNSHVVTLYQYLVLLKQKTMDKKVANEIKEFKSKEKEKENQEKLIIHLPKLRKQFKGELRKTNRSKFNDAWFVAIVKINSETFHNNFKAVFQAHPLKYIGFGLGNTYVQQRNVRKKSKAKNATCWACTNQVATFHSTIVN